MKATMTPEALLYTLEVNGHSLPGMRLESQWEFFRKLVDSRGRSLIVAVDVPDSPWTRMFESFGTQPRAGEGVTLVGGSPDLIATLKTEKTA